MKPQVNYKHPIYVFYKGCFQYKLDNELELLALQARIATTKDPNYTISCIYGTYTIPPHGKIQNPKLSSDFYDCYLSNIERYCRTIMFAKRENKK